MIRNIGPRVTSVFLLYYYYLHSEVSNVSLLLSFNQFFFSSVCSRLPCVPQDHRVGARVVPAHRHRPDGGRHHALGARGAPRRAELQRLLPLHAAPHRAGLRLLHTHPGLLREHRHGTKPRIIHHLKTIFVLFSLFFPDLPHSCQTHLWHYSPAFQTEIHTQHSTAHP